MDVLAGRKNAAMIPIRNEPTNSCQNWTVCVSASTASAAITSARARPPTSIDVFGEKRSLTAPPTSISTARGTAAAASTPPTARLDPVSSSTSQATAT
jgi:hypothetical protein